MENNINNIEELVNKDEKLIDIWGRRSPRFEKKYEYSVLRIIADYGVGASENTNAKGKILGSGYEALIMAFFIGLYSKHKLPLSEDPEDLKERGCGQPIEKWGNLDSKKNRHAYPALRSYMFMALVARTDVDWIAIDKGELKVGTAVSKLIFTMEEYINYGLAVMEEKLNSDKGYFFANRSFLDIFLQLTTKKTITDDLEDTPEELVN